MRKVLKAATILVLEMVALLALLRRTSIDTFAICFNCEA